MANLDHIIILVPYVSLANPPAWISKNFTITPGGQHADRKTENRLICFRDGSYLELIAFVDDDPKNRDEHVWGGMQYGVIDFALTHLEGDASVLFSELQQRLKDVNWKEGDIKAEYQPPKDGGRTRPDGVDVKWTVTQPVVETGYQRGALPFFCHDRTARSVRVPNSEEALTHASGAYGIKSLTICVPESKVGSLSRAFAAISGEPDLSKQESYGVFGLERVHQITDTQGTVVSFQSPELEWQDEWIERRGGLCLALNFGARVGPDGTKSSHRIDDGKSDMGEVYLDQHN